MRGDTRTWRTAAAGVAIAWLSLGAAVAAQPATSQVLAAEAAARRAVQDVFGADAEVRFSGPVLTLAPEGGVIAAAVPEPSSRTAGPVRFVLYGDLDQSQRVGRLSVRVDVRARHVRATQKVAARASITPDAVEVVTDDIGRQVLAPLPTMPVVTAATTRKALIPGEVITSIAIVAPSLVSSGQEVVTVARVGGLEVRGRAIAAQSGGLGETVIVVNPDSKRRLRGRIVADALVEVVLGS